METADAFCDVRTTGSRQTDGTRPHNLPALSWTSSRCHRLLRPLQSRIVALRRIAAVDKPGYEEDEGSRAAPPPTAKRLKVTDDRREPEGQTRRPQRTYSRKGSPSLSASSSTSHVAMKLGSRIQSRPRQKTKTPRPGVVATPILRKVQHREIDPPSSFAASSEDAKHTFEIPKLASRGRLNTVLNKLERIRHKYSASRYQLYEAILNDLDLVLRATSPQKRSATKKSLLSMCLRKVPQYAAQIEAWERLEEQEQGSSTKRVGYSLIVYDELESLGGAGNGWSHLCVLLRAHAVHLLREVIEDETLDEAFSRVLIEHCTAVGCHQETSELVESLLSRFHSRPVRDESTCNVESQRVFFSFLVLADNAHVGHSLLGTTARLFLERRLPVALLSTKILGLLWTTTASSILDDKTNPSAIRFASTALSILSISAFGKRKVRKSGSTGTRDGAALMTLTGVLGAFVAMAMVSQNLGSTANMAGKKRSDRTQRVVLQIIQEAITQLRSQGGASESSHLLLLASFLASDTTETLGITAKTALQTIWAKQNHANVPGVAKPSQLYNSTVAVICSIARCCGKATAQPSSHWFAEICKLVEELRVPSLAALRTDGAFLLAQETDDLRDLVFAETLMEGSPSDSKISIHREGYRWEEGISEWIAESPATRRDVVAQAAFIPRRSSRKNQGREDSPKVCSGPKLLAGTADKSGRSQIAAEAISKPNGPDGHQGDRRRGGKRQKAHDEPPVDECGLENAQVQTQVGDGVDELSAPFQESRLENCRLRNAVADKARGGCRRRIRTGETGRRKVLAELTLISNMTGREDDDELGL